MQLNLTGTPQEIMELLSLMHTSTSLSHAVPIPNDGFVDAVEHQAHNDEAVEYVVEHAPTIETSQVKTPSGEDVREIFQRFGGPTKLARLLGASRTTVQHWRKRNNIPSEWLDRINSLPLVAPKIKKSNHAVTIDSRRAKTDGYYDSIIHIMNVLTSNSTLARDDLFSRSGMHTKRFETVMQIMTAFGWVSVDANNMVSIKAVTLNNQLPPLDERQADVIEKAIRKYPGSTATQIARRTLIASNLVATRLLGMKGRVTSLGKGGNADPKRWYVAETN